MLEKKGSFSKNWAVLTKMQKNRRDSAPLTYDQAFALFLIIHLGHTLHF